MNPTDLPARIAALIEPEPMSGCWLWLGAPRDGYGRVMHEKVTWRAHRLVYSLLVGPIPDGLELDHLCRSVADWWANRG